MGGGTCSNCLSVKAECAHTRRKGTKNRSKASIQSLKTAKEHVSKIVSSTAVYIPPSDAAASNQILIEVAQYARSLEEQVASLQGQLIRNATNSASPPSHDSPTPEAESSTQSNGIGEGSGFRLMREDFVEKKPMDRSFQFVKAAIQHVPPNTRPMLDLPWKRPEVWLRQPWEIIIHEVTKPRHTFPDDDLLSSLVDMYFEKINPILSIIHQPSFRKALFVERKHIQDPHFGSVVLAVCALGSRHSEDPRVLLEGTTDEYSCGWKWFSQLQLVVLSISFLSATAMGYREESWLLAGMGLSFAEAAGLHHRHGDGYRNLSPLDAEQCRRAVWLLVVSDSVISCLQGGQGRVKTMQIDELDLDSPSNKDEEYWGLQELQPFGKPSRCDFIVSYIELVKILFDIQETVYPEDGEPVAEEEIIALDSQLNQWVESIPDHLKWNANLDNIFLDQSASLYATYYHAQIILHRVFIPIPGKESLNASVFSRAKLTFPSLAICTNAARSCAHVLNIHAKRGHGLLHLPTLTTILFDCTIVLFINVLSNGKKIHTQEEFSRATVDIQNCFAIMRLYERRWRFAGRRCDAIRAGLNLIKFAILSNNSASTSTHAPVSVQASHSPIVEEFWSTTTATSNSDTSSNSPSSARTRAPQHFKTLAESVDSVSHLFNLPLRTEELGNYNIPFDPTAPSGFLPGGDCLANPNDQPPMPDLGGYDAEMDLEAMFGTGFSTEQLFAEAVRPNLEPGVAQVDPWDVFSGYGWGDWSSYLMDETL
ncbi:Fungal-trans domain-containing protein [Mycena indigotica]|uniref:Fungal-trans domain-containing protein n=1 Tax=Mycena indigotica TaxID=2126181 RepID=A0A8H6SRH1_9AGAR|nr:Fungal-trans domain-containing protein [Mycena indigotica]KAF7303562.1 Fungal-trans domain-containing protein [Mycena indigotica]